MYMHYCRHHIDCNNSSTAQPDLLRSLFQYANHSTIHQCWTIEIVYLFLIPIQTVTQQRRWLMSVNRKREIEEEKKRDDGHYDATQRENDPHPSLRP